jgi:hypothetical protein
MTLFSYVVDHDTGFAPNPTGRYCTLVHCKFSEGGRRKNIVERAEIGDWLLGTGGESRRSSGNGTIIYLMCVDEKLPFQQYLRDQRFKGRSDCKDRGTNNTYALVSRHFFYFGKNAIPISRLSKSLQSVAWEKKGPGYKSRFAEKEIRGLISWFERKHRPGWYGEPRAPGSDYRSSGCRPRRAVGVK